MTISPGPRLASSCHWSRVDRFRRRGPATLTWSALISGTRRHDSLRSHREIALVTGSTKGIGKAIAERLAEHGANVVVSSRKADACNRVAVGINEARRAKLAVPIACNINYKEQLQALVDETHAKLGAIDVLVCNAALNPAYGSMSQISDDAFDKILGANIRSNHWLAQMVLPDMIAKNDGAIIIVSSIGGYRGSTTIGTYCISKAADLQCTSGKGAW